MGRSRAPLLVLVSLAACGERVFQCTDDAQCGDGYCEGSGFCSFDDPECPSGRRYGELAGDGLGGRCVAVGDTDADASTGPTTTGATLTTSTSTVGTTTTDTSTGSDPITTTPVTTTQEDSSADGPIATDTGPSESSSSGTLSETTGEPLEVSVSFGDRSDADFQGVVDDTSLLNYSPEENMGAHGDVHVDGNNFGSWQVALIRFDVSALPGDARIVGATLRLSSTDLVDPGDIDVHRLTEAWVEGASDHMPGVSNWIYRLDDATWTTEGAGDGSYDPTVLATFALDETESVFDIDLPPAAIESWRADPNANFGLLLRSIGVAQPLYIPSSEAGDELLRPLLVVTYVQ